MTLPPANSARIVGRRRADCRIHDQHDKVRHPEWVENDPTCQRCWNYYQKPSDYLNMETIEKNASPKRNNAKRRGNSEAVSQRTPMGHGAWTIRHGNAGNIFRTTSPQPRVRWGEDGIAGVSDDQQRLCLSLALWNGKTRFSRNAFWPHELRGQSRRGREGLYYYLDATPTHSYLKMLYKYPSA